MKYYRLKGSTNERIHDMLEASAALKQLRAQWMKESGILEEGTPHYRFSRKVRLSAAQGRMAGIADEYIKRDGEPSLMAPEYKKLQRRWERRLKTSGANPDAEAEAAFALHDLREPSVSARQTAFVLMQTVYIESTTPLIPSDDVVEITADEYREALDAHDRYTGGIVHDGC